MQEQVNRATSSQLVAVTLVSTLGGLALLLAAVGLYGVMSYAVAQSTRELGLRMALGANPANLLRLVISRGLRLTAGGVLFGTVAALAVTRLLGQLLYNVSPHDPLVFGMALAVMGTTAILACYCLHGAQAGPIPRMCCEIDFFQTRGSSCWLLLKLFRQDCPESTERAITAGISLRS